jgi:hypothetical protein
MAHVIPPAVWDAAITEAQRTMKERTALMFKRIDQMRLDFETRRAMLKRVGPNKYVVMSKDGKKRLSKPLSHGAAVKRLGQIEAYAAKG